MTDRSWPLNETILSPALRPAAGWMLPTRSVYAVCISAQAPSRLVWGVRNESSPLHL